MRVPSTIRRLIESDPRAAKALAIEILQAAEDMESPRALSVCEDGIRRIREYIAAGEIEEFCGAIYDQGGRFLGMFHGPSGSTTRCVIYPRQLAARVLALNGTCVVLGHNHPGQTTTPSAADRSLTNSLSRTLEALEIQLHHAVVTATSHAFIDGY